MKLNEVNAELDKLFVDANKAYNVYAESIETLDKLKEKLETEKTIMLLTAGFNGKNAVVTVKGQEMVLSNESMRSAAFAAYAEETLKKENEASTAKNIAQNELARCAMLKDILVAKVSLLNLLNRG